MRMSSSVGRLGKAGVQGSSDIGEWGPVGLAPAWTRRVVAVRVMAVHLSSPHLPSSGPIGHANTPQAQVGRLGT